MFDSIKSTLIDLLLSVFLAVLAGLLGLVIGFKLAQGQYSSQQLKAEQAAHQKYVDDVQAGNKAAAALITERTQHAANYRALERQFRALAQAMPLIAQSGAHTQTVVVTEAGQTVTRVITVPVADSTVTLGAVWLWNSALVGRDMPAGACGVDAATGEPAAACAQDAGITLTDAWANQATNAESCDADRLRYQRLIDFLNQRQGALKP